MASCPHSGRAAARENSAEARHGRRRGCARSGAGALLLLLFGCLGGGRLGEGGGALAGGAAAAVQVSVQQDAGTSEVGHENGTLQHGQHVAGVSVAAYAARNAQIREREHGGAPSVLGRRWLSSFLPDSARAWLLGSGDHDHGGDRCVVFV